MLKLRAAAKVMSITPGVRFHGDDRVKGLTVKLEFASVPIAVIEDGFVAQLNLFYSGNEYQFPELEQLIVSREVENVRAEIAGVVMTGMRVDQVRFTPLPNRTASLSLKLKGEFDEGLDALHDVLLDTTEVALVETETPALRMVS